VIVVGLSNRWLVARTMDQDALKNVVERLDVVAVVVVSLIIKTFSKLHYFKINYKSLFS
jgi:hypothetical protein